MRNLLPATVAGESFFCRICGTSHSSAVIHGDISPLQTVQMEFEKFESAIGEHVLLSSNKRTEIEVILKAVKVRLGIPLSPIYEDQQDQYMPDFGLLLDKRDSAWERIREDKEKEAEQKRRERQYEPSSDRLSESRDSMADAKEIIDESGVMKKNGEEIFKKSYGSLCRALKIK